MSSAEFDSKYIIDLCDDKLWSIKSKRDAEWETAKRKCVKSVNAGFFHRLFRRPDITLEDADIRLRQTDEFYWSTHSEIYRVYYGEVEQSVTRIRNLARAADRIRLTDEDYRSMRR